MAKADNLAKPTWDMHQKIYKQICRYNPGDERPAASRSMAIDGPMLRLAIANGKRGWISARHANGPVSIQTISEMVAVGLVDSCHAYVDFEIEDSAGAAGRYCLWTLWHSSEDLPTLEFIGPTHRELQAIWARDVECRKIAAATKRPTARKSAMKPRRGAL